VKWIESAGSRAAEDIDASPNHPSRKAVVRLLEGDPNAADELRLIYEEQASTWRSWSSNQRGYIDALRRGIEHAPSIDGAWLEICCGTGEGTAELRARAPELLTMDGSLAMVQSVPSVVPRFVCDVGSISLKDGCVAAVVGLNSVPLVVDVARILAPGGWLLLAYTFADHTPLYAPPEAVLDQLGVGWSADCSRGPWGEFQLFTRH
jgi:SAM-dependent methyltransferase